MYIYKNKTLSTIYDELMCQSCEISNRSLIRVNLRTHLIQNGINRSLWRSLDLSFWYTEDYRQYRGSKSSLIPRDSVPPHQSFRRFMLRSFWAPWLLPLIASHLAQGLFARQTVARKGHRAVYEGANVILRRDNGYHDEVETLDTLLIRQSMLHIKRNRYTKKYQLPRSESSYVIMINATFSNLL